MLTKVIRLIEVVMLTKGYQAYSVDYFGKPGNLSKPDILNKHD